MSLNEYQQFHEVISRAQRPLILFGKNHHEDVIAAGFSLAEVIARLGKEASLASPNFNLPNKLDFLPCGRPIQKDLDRLRQLVISLNVADNNEDPQIHHSKGENKFHIHITPQSGIIKKKHMEISDNHFRHDLIITLNTADLEQLDIFFTEHSDFFYSVPIINIDHEADNEHYGHLNIINLTAASISEMLYELIKQINHEHIDEAVATCLLTGMIAKTNSFKNNKVTPNSLNIASELMAAGADRQKIVDNLYGGKSVNALKLWGRVLMNLNTLHNQKIAWAEIEEKDFLETDSLPADLSGVIDELIVNIPTVEITALFFEKAGQKQVLIKSEKNHDLISHFRELSPQGKRNQIRFELNQDKQNIINKLNTLI